MRQQGRTKHLSPQERSHESCLQTSLASASFVHNPAADWPHGSKRGCFLPTSGVSSPKAETWLNRFLVFRNKPLAQASCLDQASLPFLTALTSPALLLAVGHPASSLWPMASTTASMAAPPSRPYYAMLCHPRPCHFCQAFTTLLYGYLFPLPPTHVRMLAAGAVGSSVGGGWHIPALLVMAGSN